MFNISINFYAVLSAYNTNNTLFVLFIQAFYSLKPLVLLCFVSFCKILHLYKKRIDLSSIDYSTLLLILFDTYKNYFY